MPLYFFDVRDNIKDEDGSVLSGDAQAREQAIATAAEIIRSDAATLPGNEDWEMMVRDEAGRCIVSLRFSADDYPQNTEVAGAWLKALGNRRAI
jgi:hypothetical protein